MMLKKYPKTTARSSIQAYDISSAKNKSEPKTRICYYKVVSQYS